MIKKNIMLSVLTLFLIGGIIAGVFLFMPVSGVNHSTTKNTTEDNKKIAANTDAGIKSLLADGRYKCCLLKPCSYCFSDSEHQDRELVCGCINDIMEGKHPCGECIGEILEGKGNPLISEYFASAISEEVGAKYLPVLKNIIADKYDMPVDRQI